MQPFTKIPNVILEAMQSMTEAESRLTAVLVRLTYGYHTDTVRLTWDDMLTATGYASRSSIAQAVNAVELRGFFRRGRRSVWHIAAEGANSTPNGLNEGSNSTPNGLNEDSNSTPNGLFDSDEDANSTPNGLNEDSNSTPNGLYDSTPNGLFPSGLKEKEKEEKKEDEEKERGIPPSPLAEPTVGDLFWQTAVDLVARWANKRGIYREIRIRPFKNDPPDDLDFYRPAARLVEECDGDGPRAWTLVEEKYNAMLTAGFAPTRLEPVVTQILADMDRAKAPPVPVNVNGQNGRSAPALVDVAAIFEELGLSHE